MSSAEEPIHGLLVRLAELPPGGRVLDLGCGAGPTLLAFSQQDAHAHLTGLERHEPDLTKAGKVLSGHSGRVELRRADLTAALPLPDACMDAVISYNVLECLLDPAHLLREIHRVLRPGGRSVLAHIDFDSLVFAGAPDELDRLICHAYCDDTPPWMDHGDGRMGRRMPGLVANSPLERIAVEVHTTRATRLKGHAADRAADIRAALLAAARQGRGQILAEDVERWHAGLKQADAADGFFFAESAIVVTARRGPSDLGAWRVPGWPSDRMLS